MYCVDWGQLIEIVYMKWKVSQCVEHHSAKLPNRNLKIWLMSPRARQYNTDIAMGSNNARKPIIGNNQTS